MNASSDDRQRGLRQALEERARRLRDEVQAVDAERADAPTRRRDEVEDAGDQGEQRSRDEVRSAERERDAAELSEISAALDRMDQGRYGECVDCGVDIPIERLIVQPAAARCVPCQERREAVVAGERRNAQAH